jgi:hypothetical protein
MASLKGKKLKVNTAPIKNLNQLNIALDAIFLPSAIQSTHKGNLISIKFKNGNGGIHKLSYIGKFNYSSHTNLLQSKVYGYKHYFNNKINELLTGVSFTIGEAAKASSSPKKANKLISKLLKKNDTIIGGKANDNLWGYAGNDKISGGSGNDTLCGGIGNDKLIGGKGKDIFKLSKGKGYDLIQDFKNKQDKIFIGSIKKIKLKNKGKDVLIYSGKDLLAKVKKAKGLLSKKSKYLV